MNAERIVDQVRTSRTRRKDAEQALMRFKAAAEAPSDGELLELVTSQNTLLRQALEQQGLAIAALEQALMATTELR